MTTALRLYELPAAFAAWEAAVDERDGELHADAEAELDALELTLETKADAIAGLIREAELEAVYYGSEADRLTKRKRVATAKADRLKTYLKTTLKALDRPSIQTARFKIRVQSNSMPTIRWHGVYQDLPERFLRVEPSLDSAAALAELKAKGELPEGFEITKGDHLRIS